MKKTEKITVKYPSALPLWAAAAVWLLAAALLPMYLLHHYLIVAALSLAAGLITWKIKPFHTETKEVEIKESVTGNEEIDAVLKELSDASYRLGDLEAAASGEFIAQVASVRSTLSKISDSLRHDPADLKQCKKLTRLYLPTVLKLADKYLFIKSSDSSEETARKTMESIEDAFLSIDSMLIRQLDALFENDALDISTDITVLEAMLNDSGLENTKGDSI